MDFIDAHAARAYILDQGEIILSSDEQIQRGLASKMEEYKKRQDAYTAQKDACIYLIRSLLENRSVRPIDAIDHVNRIPQWRQTIFDVANAVYRIVNFNAHGHCDGKYLPGMEGD